VPAFIAIDGEAERLTHTEDVSFGGASLLSPHALKPDTPVTLRLRDPEPLTIEGTVMSCAPTADGAHRLGISFQALALDDEKRLLFLLLEAAIDNDGNRHRHVALSPARRVAIAGAEA
jgi:hypothetical protein